MDLHAQVDALPWFSGLEPSLRAALTTRGRLHRRAVGEWLWGEGDEETGVAGVIAGALNLYAQTPDGGEALFSLLPRGGVLGQSILFGGGPRLVTAICATDSLLFIVSDRALRDTAGEHPTLWPALSALVFGQLRETLRTTVEFLALSPRARLVSRLAQLSAFDARVPVNQSALAEMIGASRNAVNGWLRELEGAGAIVRGYGFIDVVNRKALQHEIVH